MTGLGDYVATTPGKLYQIDPNAPPTRWTMTFALPLRVVNPLNRREHWGVKAKRTARERAVVTLRLKGEARGRLGYVPPLPLLVTFTRIAPRPFDSDGLPASFKGCRDAVAAFYGCDDGPKETRLRWAYEWRKGAPKQYAVEVRLEPLHG